MIGIIIRADKEVEELEKDWVPSAFSVSELSEAFEKVLGYVPSTESFCHEEGEALIYFTIDDLAEPRAVTFNCALVGSLDVRFITVGYGSFFFFILTICYSNIIIV